MNRAALAIILLLAPVCAHAEDASSNTNGAARLKELRAKIGGAEKKLGDIRLDRERLAATLEKLRSEQAGLELRKKEESAELKRIERELQALDLSKDENEKHTTLEKEALEERLVEMYKLQRRREGVSFLLSAASSQDLLHRAHMLSILAADGDQTLYRLSELQGRLSAEQARYEIVREERSQSIAGIQRLGTELDKKRKDTASVLSQAEEREQQQKALLSQLRGEAKVLEEALASVMGEEETPERPEEKGFNGTGLASLKGKLAFPVKGKVLQGFGRSQHEEFSDLLVVKGLEVSSTVGTPVKPVAAGKVVLAQVIPGFGNVVIIDHGERYYSLYGRLASSQIQVGELVQGKETIGLTGEQDYRGRNFYFELRFRGKAVDPKEFFGHLPS